MQTMVDGQTILVTAYDPAAPLDIKAWCRRTGNTLVSMSLADNRFLLRKGNRLTYIAQVALKSSRDVQYP
jgi:TusA-related sulfurtransferase